MAVGAHKITEEFERVVAEYTGAPYAIALDNMSNALFLALMWWGRDKPTGFLQFEKKPTPEEIEKIKNEWEKCFSNKKSMTFPIVYGIPKQEIEIPSHTYPSVPCEIIHAGFKVKFLQAEGDTLTGPYQLSPSPVWDCALRFTSKMYVKGQFQCLSFTGPYKHLKLSKGGMILTDDAEAARWFKRVRFSGRNECSYHDDNFDMIGWNFYMMPELAARGLLLMAGMKEHNEDLTIKYPDLSKFKVYQQ